MIIEKDYLIKSPIEKVWDFISKPKLFGECIPDVGTYKQVSNRHFVLTINPKFAFLKTTIVMDWKVLFFKRNHGKLSIKGKAIGSTFEAVSELKLLKKKAHSLLKLNVAIIKLSGLLKPVPDTIIKAAALKIADDIFNCVSHKLEGK